MKPNIVFTCTKLSSNFNVKDPVPFTEKHDIIYWSVCATESCNEDYVGECARRLYEHVKYHNGRDHSSHLVKQAGEISIFQFVKIEYWLLLFNLFDIFTQATKFYKFPCLILKKKYDSSNSQIQLTCFFVKSLMV